MLWIFIDIYIFYILLQFLENACRKISCTTVLYYCKHDCLVLKWIHIESWGSLGLVVKDLDLQPLAPLRKSSHPSCSPVLTVVVTFDKSFCQISKGGVFSHTVSQVHVAACHLEDVTWQASRACPRPGPGPVLPQHCGWTWPLHSCHDGHQHGHHDPLGCVWAGRWPQSGSQIWAPSWNKPCCRHVPVRLERNK